MEAINKCWEVVGRENDAEVSARRIDVQGGVEEMLGGGERGTRNWNGKRPELLAAPGSVSGVLMISTLIPSKLFNGYSMEPCYLRSLPYQLQVPSSQSESPAWPPRRAVDVTSANASSGTHFATHHQVVNSVLGVELDTNLVPKAGVSSIETARLDASHIRHDLELGVQRATTVRAKPMLVDFATVSDSIVVLRLACDATSGQAHCDITGSSPLVTLKFVRGTTALLVYGPPVHF